MNHTGADQYLHNKVMTASPAQLQLMLFDGAIRFGTEARAAIEANEFEKSFETLTRTQKIVLEMQGGLNFDVDPNLCSKMSGLYTFIYKRLVDASVERDVKPLDEALRLLRYQRETWVMLMERLADEAEPLNVPPPNPDGQSGALSVQG